MAPRNFPTTIWEHLGPFLLHLSFYSVIWKANVVAAVFNHEEGKDFLGELELGPVPEDLMEQSPRTSFGLSTSKFIHEKK